MELRALTGGIGMEVSGIDLAQPLSGADGDTIRTALYEHCALVFRNQDLAPQDQVRFTELFGPCEPMIPVLMYPALEHSRIGVVIVALVFATVTLATMLGIVLSVLLGARRVRSDFAERYSHALAGGAVLACGVAMKFFGL